MSSPPSPSSSNGAEKSKEKNPKNVQETPLTGNEIPVKISRITIARFNAQDEQNTF